MDVGERSRNRLEIEYCTGCRWILRAAWMAQELLFTFQEELSEVSLIPGSGGIFEIRINGEVLSNRKKDKGFPELKSLKVKIRNKIAPDKGLGHSEQSSSHS